MSSFLRFVEPLIASVEGMSLLPSPFSNLGSLKIYPVHLPSDDEALKKVNMSSKVLNFLRDGSPSITFTLISYEEMKEIQQKAQAIANATTAQKLMANLQVMLEKEKADIQTMATRMRRMESQEENSTNEEQNDTDDQDKSPVEKMQLREENGRDEETLGTFRCTD